MSHGRWDGEDGWRRWGMLEAIWRGKRFDCPGLTTEQSNALLNKLVLWGFVRKSDMGQEESWTVTQEGVNLIRDNDPPEKPDLLKEDLRPDASPWDRDKERVELTLRTREGKEVRTGLILPRGYKVNIVDAKDGRVELVPERKVVRFTEKRFDDLMVRIIKKYAPVMPSAEADDIGWLVNLVAEQRKLLRDARVGFEALEQGVHFSGLEKATLELIKELLEAWSNG